MTKKKEEAAELAAARPGAAIIETLAGAVGFPEGTVATPTSLSLPDRLPFEEWTSIGTRLQGAREALEGGIDVIHWWTGDWLLHGEHSYGEKFAQAAEQTGKAEQTLANIQWVAKSVDPSRRREPGALTFSHHGEVAALGPKDQDDLLSQAEEHGWSVRQLRETVRERTDSNDGRDFVRAEAERSLAAARLKLEPVASTDWAVLVGEHLVTPLFNGARPKDAGYGFLEDLALIVNVMKGEDG